MLFDASKKFYGHLKSARSRPKRSSQNVQKLDFENFVQNPSFSWAEFSLRLFCSTRVNATGIRALDSPDLGASHENLKQCCLMRQKNFTATWSQLIHDFKSRPKTSKSWILKISSKILVFHGLSFHCVFFVLRVQMPWEYVRWTCLTLGHLLQT